jgi:hypothetical protein
LRRLFLPRERTFEMRLRPKEKKLTRAERAEVLGRLGHDVGAQLHDDAAERGAAGGDVEEHARVGHFGGGGGCFLLGVRSERERERRAFGGAGDKRVCVRRRRRGRERVRVK